MRSRNHINDRTNHGFNIFLFALLIFVFFFLFIQWDAKLNRMTRSSIESSKQKKCYFAYQSKVKMNIHNWLEWVDEKLKEIQHKIFSSKSIIVEKERKKKSINEPLEIFTNIAFGYSCARINAKMIMRKSKRITWIKIFYIKFCFARIVYLIKKKENEDKTVPARSKIFNLIRYMFR